MEGTQYNELHKKERLHINRSNIMLYIVYILLTKNRGDINKKNVYRGCFAMFDEHCVDRIPLAFCIAFYLLDAIIRYLYTFGHFIHDFSLL